MDELLMMTPGLLLDHVRDHAAADEPGALEIDVDHGVPLVLGQLVREAVGRDAGVVEEDVDSAELRVLSRRRQRVTAESSRTSPSKERQVGADVLAVCKEAIELGGGAHRVGGVGDRLRDVEGGDSCTTPG